MGVFTNPTYSLPPTLIVDQKAGATEGKGGERERERERG